jgi:hypothetical protein
VAACRHAVPWKPSSVGRKKERESETEKFQPVRKKGRKKERKCVSHPVDLILFLIGYQKKIFPSVDGNPPRYQILWKNEPWSIVIKKLRGF